MIIYLIKVNSGELQNFLNSSVSTNIMLNASQNHKNIIANLLSDSVSNNNYLSSNNDYINLVNNEIYTSGS
jgi:hypothetical protein